jgi:hypothetical protein
LNSAASSASNFVTPDRSAALSIRWQACDTGKCLLDPVRRSGLKAVGHIDI